MIGPMFGAGPARGFYNRGGGPASPRRALGTATSNGSPLSLSLNGLSLIGAETLLVGIVNDNRVNATPFTVSFAGLSKNQTQQDISENFSTTWATWIYSFGMGGTPRAGNLVVDWSGAPATPTRCAILAVAVNSITNPVATDRLPVGAGTSTTQGTAVSANTAQAVEFFWGVIGTVAGAGDTRGNWSNSWSAGQRAYLSAPLGVDLKEGYFFATSIQTVQAQVTGATSRAFGACGASYK